MPGSSYLQVEIEKLVAEYQRKFPNSLFPAKSYLVTHITPGEERLKKMVFLFPSPAGCRRSYSGLPAVAATIHQDNKGSEVVVLTVTDIITASQSVRRLRVSKTRLSTNRRAMDATVSELRRALWRVGPARPDHYAE